MRNSVLKVTLSLAAAMGLSCRSADPPVAAPVVVPGAAPIAIAPAAPPEPQLACPVVPLQLVTADANGKTMVFLTLGANGELRTPLDPSKPFGHLDPRGCVVTSWGVEVEATRQGPIWTRNEWFDIEDATLHAWSKTFRIDPDGSVRRFLADGGTDPDAAGSGSLIIRGYREEAACAARVLLVTFLLMMPSMAVVDGQLEPVPPPEESVCPEIGRDDGPR
jgi:hypothetical protein